MITAAQWLQVLTYCGVRFVTATAWSKVFEARVQASAFSAGARELDDFVGQVLYETSKLEHLVENLNYSADRIRELGNASPAGSRWRSLVPQADALAHEPSALANAAYGGRLGNTAPDDGWTYAGAGIPQVTGKANYQMLQDLTGLPLIAHPEMLRVPDTAMQCGILWFNKKVPDSAIDSVELVTRAVQGGELGLAERKDLTSKASTALVACGAL